ncbi:MAG: DUF2244 domain-containing protein [Alphaproteobacteria bacterium]|nr:DUF2244 domain-containing protein [Alphaproteobacteria bacterium]
MSSSAEKDELLLSESLRPAPTLPPRVLLAILCVVAAINLAFMTAFALKGAWPIAPFLGADVALLAWAFRQSRLAAAREELVTLTRSLLTIARKPQTAGGAIRLNPYWVRLQMDEPPQHGSQLTLWSHGKAVRIGSFLPPLERAAVGSRLKAALWRARHG